MSLDIKKEAEALRTLYASTASQQKRNFLLLGDSGSGKTQCASTAPRPIHIFSFDPGGTKTQAVQEGIKAGWGIKAGIDCGIYCGLNLKLSEKERAVIIAKLEPKNIILGTYKKGE